MRLPGLARDGRGREKQERLQPVVDAFRLPGGGQLVGPQWTGPRPRNHPVCYQCSAMRREAWRHVGQALLKAKMTPAEVFERVGPVPLDIAFRDRDAYLQHVRATHVKG